MVLDIGHNEVEVTILRGINDGETWRWPGTLSPELQEMLMKELEFGVNLPDDQDYDLRVRLVFKHRLGGDNA